MKYLYLSIALVCCSCGSLHKDKSQVVSTTFIGLHIGVDYQKVPVVKMGYMKLDYANLKDGKSANIDRDYSNINLIGGAGTAKTSVGIK